jgi:type I restriction enzyme S subunit
MKPNWPLHPLGELAQLRSGGTPARSATSLWNGTVPWFSGKDLKSFFLSDSIEHVTHTAVACGAYTVPSGTLLILVRGMALMKSVPLGITSRESTFNQDVKAILPNPEKIDAVFLGYYLLSQEARIRGLVTTAGHGTGRLPLEALEEYPTPVPPLPEQRKIAASLRSWDEALGQLAALSRAKERRKTALMQQLLTGRQRLKRFTGKWTDAPLGSVVAPNARIVPKPSEAFLAAGIRSHGKGVFLKRQFKPEDIALEELFQIRANDLVVNITFAWEGAVAIVPPEADGALVSHRFPTYECIPGKTVVAFLRHVIRSRRFVFACGLASPGGAGRNRVLGKDAFLGIPIQLPPLPEQEAIAAVLDTCDEELRLLRAQRAAVDQQKRGLMQELLTGRLRVRV